MVGPRVSALASNLPLLVIEWVYFDRSLVIHLCDQWRRSRDGCQDLARSAAASVSKRLGIS